MNKNSKKVYLIVFLLGSLNTSDNLTANVSIVNAACDWAKKDNNAQITVGSFLGGFLAHQYYQHKTRPKDEDISAEGFTRRWNEIVHGDISIYTKIKRLISFIDDFYVFGRRPKSVETETTTFAEDGTETVIKDKKTVIKGTGPVTFLYSNVFDKLEEILKSMGALGAFVLLLDGLLNGQLNLIFKPMEIKAPVKNDLT